MKECESTKHLIVRDGCGPLPIIKAQSCVYVITVCLENRDAAFLCS